jgi:hypothetical protein
VKVANKLKYAQSMVLFLPARAQQQSGHFVTVTFTAVAAVAAPQPRAAVCMVGGVFKLPTNEQTPVFVRKSTGTGCTVCSEAVKEKLMDRPINNQHNQLIDFVAQWSCWNSEKKGKNKHLKTALHKEAELKLAEGREEAARAATPSTSAAPTPSAPATQAPDTINVLHEDVEDEAMFNLHASIYTATLSSASSRQTFKLSEAGRIQGAKLPHKYMESYLHIREVRRIWYDMLRIDFIHRIREKVVFVVLDASTLKTIRGAEVLRIRLRFLENACVVEEPLGLIAACFLFNQIHDPINIILSLILSYLISFFCAVKGVSADGKEFLDRTKELLSKVDLTIENISGVVSDGGSNIVGTGVGMVGLAQKELGRLLVMIPDFAHLLQNAVKFMKKDKGFRRVEKLLRKLDSIYSEL